MADVYKVLQPAKYLKDFISRNTRSDGRKFDHFRWTVLNPGSITTADGSCTVKLGHTKIVCGIKAELTTPPSEKPNEGIVVTNLELPPLCSSQFRSGPPGDTAQACNQLIADIFNDTKCINLEDLCIAKDKLVWVLFCDMVCMDYDGSIIDACIMALMTALRTVKLPEVDYNLATGACEVHEHKRKELNILKYPVATTFTLFESDIMLADPTSEEEKLCGGPLGGTTIIHCLVKEGKEKQPEEGVEGIHRLGGVPLPPATVQRALALSATRTAQVQSLISAAIKQQSQNNATL